MDEYASADVFCIETANDRKALPDSLLRPGRFDCVMKMYLPESRDSEKILRYYLEQQKLSDDIDMEPILRLVDGKSCAGIEKVINDAGLHAAYNGNERVDQDSLIYAFLKDIDVGACIMSEATNASDAAEAHDTAVHEIGHALIAEVLNPGSVNLVALLKSNYTEISGVTNRRSEPWPKGRDQWENDILVKLGGRAAKEVVLGELDMGCRSDFYGARYAVSRLVEVACEYGTAASEVLESD